MIPVPLREAIFWIAAALCVVAEIGILRSMFRGTRTAHPDRSPSVDADVPRAPAMGEMIWAVLPAIGLIVILAITRGAIR